MSEAKETAGPEQEAARRITRRAGSIIIGLGCFELVWGIMHAPPGTMNFRFTGLLVGLLVLYGGLRTHAVVRWLALLATGAWLPDILMSFAIVPPGLTLVQMRLHPAAFAASFVPWLAWAAISGIAALALSHPLLLAARARAGRTVHSARIPLVIGMVAALATAIFVMRMTGGEAGEKAKALAAGKLGPTYQYYTRSLNYSRQLTGAGRPTTVFANVQAWNDHEVVSVPVMWTE